VPTVSTSRKSGAAALVAAALVGAFGISLRAHDPGLSSLDVSVEHDRVVTTLSLAEADARAASVSGSRLGAFALESVELRLDGVRLSGVVEREAADDDAGARVTLVFERADGERLTVRSRVPARLARGHRQLLTVRGAADTFRVERMLDARTDTTGVDVGSVRRSTDTARQFLALGVRHILGGYDHLLFLGALLLGVRRLRSVVTTVTAFTAAHSLTLSLAVSGLVRVPAAIVEPLIAASIVFVGIENLVRGQMDSRWKLTFAFGLVHGFGFAGALQELGVGTRGMSIAAPLAWFNIGVEAGQIAIAAALWPLIGQLNARPALRLRLVPACSALVVAAGAYWVVERVF
jgi:hydrogenase/urease accessory protein HupE